MIRNAYLRPSMLSKQQIHPTAKSVNKPIQQLSNDSIHRFNKENDMPISKIEMFKCANFSFIELMNKNRLSHSLCSQSSKANSQLSTPRLTPLRMIERNRETDKNDMNRLESKILELEKQICNAKK